MNIDFPFRFDHRGRTALATDDKHVRDMIEQFLFTSAGERVNRPDFGSGLLQMVFAPNSPELAATLKFVVQAGLQQWLGDMIEINAIDVSSEEATLRIELKYLVKQTQENLSETFVRRAAP